MKKYILFVCVFAIAAFNLAACKKDSVSKTPGVTQVTKKAEKKKKSILTPVATGAPYEILVVADASAFSNGAYDTLKAVLTDDIDGLFQSEPNFKVSYVTSGNLSKSLRYCRNIIMLGIDRMYSSCRIKYTRDMYAAPQMVMTIQAPSAFQFIDYVRDNAGVITDFFVKSEMNRQADALKGDNHPVVREKVMKKFGCEIWAPTELRKTKEGRDFFWASTDGAETSFNMVVYSFPYRDLNTFTRDYFVRKRDSVMKANIPGPNPGQYMQTTSDFLLVSDIAVHGEYAQLVRGYWNIKDYDMGGPFVSVSRVDEKNQRVVVAETFLFAPNKQKGPTLRKYEAALYTLRLPDELDLDKFQYNLDEIIINPED